MSRLLEETREILDEVALEDDGHYRVAGTTYAHIPRTNRFFAVGPDLPAIVGAVAQVLYDRYYLRSDQGRGPYVALPDPVLRDFHALALVRANAGQQTGATPVQPGFFHLSGDTDHPFDRPATGRCYFNVCRPGAVPLVAALTRELNAAGVPFHFKIVDDPQRFTRSDGAVLYLPADALSRVREPLRAVYDAVGRYLKRPVPRWSRALAPGLGYAADPGNGESFGMHRCRLVTEALWTAHLDPATPVDDHIEAVFRAAGVDPATPHLGPADVPDLDLDLTPDPTIEAVFA